MGSVSLEAFDMSIRGKYTQWILPNPDVCTIPRGFQDQVMSGTQPFQTQILLLSKQDSKAWMISHTWDLTFIPDTMPDWNLLCSIIPHLKKPVLIVTTPQCRAPEVFWTKCFTFPTPQPTCVSLRVLGQGAQGGHGGQSQHMPGIPYSIFFPPLQDISEFDFLKMPGILIPSAIKSFESLDLRSLYRELRGAGASLCMSQTDSRSSDNMPQYSAMWFYPEINGALRLHLSDLRKVLRTVTERLAES